MLQTYLKWQHRPRNQIQNKTDSGSFSSVTSLIPGPRLTRRVFTLSSKRIRLILAHEPMAASRLMNPEIWGIQPTLEDWPSELWKIEPGHRFADHILEIKPSPYTSFSTSRLGPPYQGRLIFVDPKKVLQEPGTRVVSTDEIKQDLLIRLAQETDPVEIVKINEYLRIATVRDREVLVQGSIRAGAVRSFPVMITTRAIQVLFVVGLAVTVADEYAAAKQSLQTHSARPILKETARQTGGWGGALLGAKLGSVSAATIGVESGPVDVGVALAGGVIGGAVGYFSADLVIRHCPHWVLKRVK